MSHYGKVKTWNNEKKFGFILPQEGGKDLFFHQSELPKGKIVERGEILTYEVGKDKDGRVRAVNINNSHATRIYTKSTRPTSGRTASKRRESSSQRTGFQRMRPHKQVLFVIVVTVAIISMGSQLLERVDSSGTKSNSSSQSSDSRESSYQSGKQVRATGKVIRILSDDLKGSRHQRFILQVSDRTLLIAHNIDIASRITNLRRNDRVEFNGVYEWNDKGGVVHWTHRDPSGNHEAGWLKHKGKIYQ